jgi:hypothetical protein
MEAVDTCQRRILYLDSYSRSALKLRVALVCRLPRVRAISARARSGVVCVPVWRDCARLQLRLLACGFVSASASVQYSASVHYWMRVSRPAGSTRFRPWVCVCVYVCVCVCGRNMRSRGVWDCLYARMPWAGVCAFAQYALHACSNERACAFVYARIACPWCAGDKKTWASRRDDGMRTLRGNEP